MSYNSIDPTITTWTEKHSLHLFSKFADKDVRCIYVSSNIGECFQISISDPQDNVITVQACDIETYKDEKLEATIIVEETKLHEALEGMLATVYNWMKRHDPSANRHFPKSKI